MTAEQLEIIKALLPTSLGSEELRSSIAADILRQSVFSARMENARYLAMVRAVCAQVAGGGMNLADARMRLTQTLSAMGHDTAEAHGITDPASIKRINLVVETQAETAAGAARVNSQTDGTLYAFPAWELVRYEGRRMQRDWAARWKAAGSAVGWEGVSRDFGRMVALKDSPIWQALGNGAGGYRDTLGNPYPPFAFNSGMDWDGVRRDECVELGLIGEDYAPGAPARASLAPSEDELSEAVQRTGIDVARGLQ